MLDKLKITALKDLFLSVLVLYCSGWVILIFYVIMDSIFDNPHYGVNGRYTAELFSDPSRIFEQIIMFGIIIFPLMALLGLVSIKVSIQKLQEEVSKNHTR